MSTTSPEFSSFATADRLAELQRAAAELGMRLVRIDLSENEPEPHFTHREDFIDFAAATGTPKAVAFKGWRRLQELYTARVQFEAANLVTPVPHTTPLIFCNTQPLPSVNPLHPDSWIAWRQTLTDLDTDSLRLFTVQLDNAESRFGRNPQSDLLGKPNGPVMYSFFKRFVAAQPTSDPAS